MIHDTNRLAHCAAIKLMPESVADVLLCVPLSGALWWSTTCSSSGIWSWWETDSSAWGWKEKGMRRRKRRRRRKKKRRERKEKMEPVGTTATSSQVHEASVCVSFCSCRCLCMQMWQNFLIFIYHFLLCLPFVFFFFACTYVCVTCAYPTSMFGLSFPSFHIILSSTDLSGFSNRRKKKSLFLSSSTGVQEPSRHQLSPLAVKPHTFHSMTGCRRKSRRNESV